MWDTKLSTQSTEVTDTSSGPGAPDVEFIGAPLTFYRHAQVPPAPGDKSFTLVSFDHTLMSFRDDWDAYGYTIRELYTFDL